jgi:hypothetical protein
VCAEKHIPIRVAHTQGQKRRAKSKHQQHSSKATSFFFFFCLYIHTCECLVVQAQYQIQEGQECSRSFCGEKETPFHSCLVASGVQSDQFSFFSFLSLFPSLSCWSHLTGQILGTHSLFSIPPPVETLVGRLGSTLSHVDPQARRNCRHLICMGIRPCALFMEGNWTTMDDFV